MLQEFEPKKSDRLNSIAADVETQIEVKKDDLPLVTAQEIPKTKLHSRNQRSIE